MKFISRSCRQLRFILSKVLFIKKSPDQNQGIFFAFTFQAYDFRKAHFAISFNVTFLP